MNMNIILKILIIIFTPNRILIVLSIVAVSICVLFFRWFLFCVLGTVIFIEEKYEYNGFCHCINIIRSLVSMYFFSSSCAWMKFWLLCNFLLNSIAHSEFVCFLSFESTKHINRFTSLYIYKIIYSIEWFLCVFLYCCCCCIIIVLATVW